MSESLQERLEIAQRQLDLVLSIDHIRDTAPDPAAMLSAIADLLADRFYADLCLICLLNRETKDLELKAVNDRSYRFGDLSPALAGRIKQIDRVTIWSGDDVPTELGLGDGSGALQVAVIPIVLRADQRLGALLLVRSAHPFSEAEVKLLKTAESQLDSAVVQGYAFYDLALRNKELETVYRVDRIRDQQLPFDEMLNAALHELRAAIQAGMGFVMLYDRAGKRLELRASTHDDLLRVSTHQEIVDRVANEALQRAELVCYNGLGDALHSLICIPLILHNEIIGVLG